MSCEVSTNVKDAIRSYVTQAFLAGGRTATVSDDDDLMEMLDSLQILRMVIDLESRFSIRVENADLTPENLGSVDKVAAFVARKQH